jgi:hypothetical protein
MNKNIKALSDYNEAMRNPLETIKDIDAMTKYMGAVNQLLYGANPFAKKVIEPTPEELRADQEFLDAEKGQSESEAYRLAH